jgi:hypothetical protein
MDKKNLNEIKCLRMKLKKNQEKNKNNNKKNEDQIE